VAARLAVAGFHSVAVDQRGHGETGGSGDRLADFVDDACALLDHLQVPVVFVGASLGGFVSLLASARSGPSLRVAGVVLVDVVPDPEADGPVRAYLRSLESPGRTWNWPLVEDILAQTSLLCDAAARSRVPLALIRGEHGVISDDVCSRFRALVPSVVVRTVEGAGHLVARERPEPLADALIELLGSLPSPHWRER
jgi:pimeloyl-ACP methyl ester carboxylesterase